MPLLSRFLVGPCQTLFHAGILCNGGAAQHGRPHFDPPEPSRWLLRVIDVFSSRIPTITLQTLIGGTVFFLGLAIAYELGGIIAQGNTIHLEFTVLAFAACGAAVVIFRNWRTGFYFFLGWLIFEDLARKYMHNNLALFFGKDFLAALTYVSLYAAIRKGREKSFRPAFLLPLAIFVWLSFI